LTTRISHWHGSEHPGQRVTLLGLIITLGIVYGDIGTSPLYVMEAVGLGLGTINKDTVYGSISLVVWTLTLQTTIKYVFVTLRADNKGEGGIFALYTLIRKKAAWAYIPALIGGSTLLADGVITPAITVTSAVEGLTAIYPTIPVVLIVILIFMALFSTQRFGTRFLGQSFGPLMFIWFTTIALLGISWIVRDYSIFQAINPAYGIRLLINYPGSFIILGAVFLATTGAEALYSDLGHVGLWNIRISWIMVKIALILNYLGQGVWMLSHPGFPQQHGLNPFFEIMPDWFRLSGVLISTIAAIIASQALISGSFTLISEAITLNFWPKIRIKYPSDLKGQMYIPMINVFLWIACSLMVIFFQESSRMEAAYGLSITITMLMTTSLLLIYLSKQIPVYLVALFGSVYLIIEGSFLIANMYKFRHGGWFTIMLGAIFSIIMYVWYNGRKIKNRLMEFMKLSSVIQVLRSLQEDISITKFATNVVYITKANNKTEIESTIVYSLINKQPKRADIYWFLHVDIKDEPFTFEYEVSHFIPGKIIKVDFFLGFKIEHRINLYFRQIIEDLSRAGEIDILSRYPSLRENSIPSDFKFILIERTLTRDQMLSLVQKIIMEISDLIGKTGVAEESALNLDTSNVVIEKVPLGLHPIEALRIKRIHKPVWLTEEDSDKMEGA
jgi:KUP system potassium uptake protein